MKLLERIDYEREEKFTISRQTIEQTIVEQEGERARKEVLRRKWHKTEGEREAANSSSTASHNILMDLL